MSDSKLLKELKAKIKELESRLQDHVIKQKELHSYKQQIDAMFDNAPVELYLKDREGRYLKINRHFEKIFGVRNEDLVGKLPSDAHKPELAESTRNQDMAVLSSGKVVRREEKVQLLTDSRIHTLLTIKFPIFDTEGRVDGLGAIATDITDQKLAEERFRDMVNTIDGIVWEAFTTENQFSYVSQQAVRFLGYSIEEWLVPGFWVEKMHPKDRDRVIENCRKSLTNGLDRFELEYRLIAKDGRIVWVRDLISVSREDDNQPLLRGVMIDITRQKEIEELTRSAENRFKTIYMAAPLGIVLTDLATGNLIESNPAYSRIIGRSMDEMKSLGWQAITHPDDLEQDLHQLKQMQEGRKTSYKFSKRFIKPDDSVVWVELTAVLISTEGDSRSQYLAILEDITERRQFEERIWQQANYDLLTGLPNRNMLQDRLEQLIKKEKRGGLEFALLLIDLDQFKEVNDTLGHDRGDELLIDAAKRIRKCLRESDTVARIGGDEFVIILSELSLLSGVELVAQHIIDALSESFLLGQESAFVSASIGITLYPEDAREIVGLMKNADQAMYSAKKLGGNRYHFFTQAMQQEALNRMQLKSDMHVAIRENQFKLYYQPVVELETGKIHKAEALLRWQHESRGLISPADFIEVAEDSRMIIDIGDWVFLEAARQIKYWRESISSDFQVSINASPIQFENQSSVSWRNHLHNQGIDGQAICIEITESLLMTSDQSVLDTLLGFRDAGIQVALDDFGTGYSSLSYLRKFDIDYLKIDRSFVQNLSRNSDDLALCAAIIVMAHKLGIKVVGEGIESEAQKDLLVSIGCDFGQGNLFSMPIPADEFERFLQDTA